MPVGRISCIFMHMLLNTSIIIIIAYMQIYVSDNTAPPSNNAND